MNQRLTPAFLTMLFLLGAATASAEEERPNVLMILADDLGYMDVSPYNPDTFYETPNIQRLAESAARFTDGYAANPVCSPTRYSIMTGTYPTRHDATDWFCGSQTARYRHAPLNCFMPVEEVTVAEAFKEAGYRTFFAGKWHLGPKPKHWPRNQGFDVNKGGNRCGSPSCVGGGYFSPYNNIRLEDGPKGEYLPYRLAKETSSFMRKNKDQPFFAALWLYEVHNPKQAPDYLKHKYKQKRAKLDLTRDEKFDLIEQVWPVNRPRKVRVRQSHPVYAGMVEAMDRAVGRVLKTLRELDLREETIVIFFSDNGGLSTAEGHNTSNRPLKAGKGWLYEGGIREPLIIRWPGKTEPGSTIDEPVTSTDFYPTLLDAADLPARPDQHKDGVSLVPLLTGEKQELDREALFWHYPHYSNQGGFPGGAIRMGPWKLIERYENGNVELYNVENDRSEQQDVAGKHPDRVNQMRNRLHDWYDEVDAKFLRPKGDNQNPWRPDP